MKWGITCFFEDRKEFAAISDLAPRYPIEYIEMRGERPFFSPEDLTPSDLKFFKDIIEKSGLKVTVHATFYDINLATINSYLRKANMECYRKFLDLSGELGAEVMVVHAGYLHRDASGIPALLDNAKNNLVENLKILGDYGLKKNVKIGLENSPPNRNTLMIADWNNHLEILGRVNHPNVGALLDTAHAYLHGLDLNAYYQKIRPHLVEIHAHNNNGKEDEHLGMNRGTIDYVTFFKENQISVPVIMEIRNFVEAAESMEWIRQFEEVP
ncbi:MAG: sugar phosphate isomerase/epimerase [Calditrichia bacterium]